MTISQQIQALQASRRDVQRELKLVGFEVGLEVLAGLEQQLKGLEAAIQTLQQFRVMLQLIRNSEE